MPMRVGQRVIAAAAALALLSGCSEGTGLTIESIETKAGCLEVLDGGFVVIVVRVYNFGVEPIELVEVSTPQGLDLGPFVGGAPLPPAVTPGSSSGWAAMSPLDGVILAPDAAGFQILLTLTADRARNAADGLILRYRQADRELAAPLAMDLQIADPAGSCEGTPSRG